METNGQPVLADWLAHEMSVRNLGQRELAERAGLVHCLLETGICFGRESGDDFGDGRFAAPFTPISGR